jgi:tetratricopeptide (TPR) repeat protein
MIRILPCYPLIMGISLLVVHGLGLGPRKPPSQAASVLSSTPFISSSGRSTGCQDNRSQGPGAAADGQDKRSQALRLLAEAEELVKQGRDSLPKAIEKYQSALLLLEAADDRVREGMTLVFLGQVYDRLGEKQKALDCFERGAAISHQAGTPKWEGNSLYGMGLVYSSLGEYKKALDFFSRALPLRRAATDRFAEAVTLNNLGLTYLATARYQEALEALLEALPIRRELKDNLGEAYTLEAIGSVYYSLGDFGKAIEYYDQALPVLQSRKNQPIQAYILNDLGLNYWILGKSQKALDYYGKALAIWTVLDNVQGKAYTLNNEGMAYNSLGERQKALDLYLQALDLEVKDRKAAAYTQHNIGDVLTELNRDDEALDHYKEALALKQSIEDRDGEAATLAGIARLDRKRGDLAAARREIEAALGIIESLRTRVAPQGLRASYFGSKSDYYEFYVDLLMSLDKNEPGAGWDIAALRASDRARARSLLDSLGATRARISPEPAVVDRERLLGQQLEASATRLTAVLAGAHSEEQAVAARQAVDAALIEAEGARAAIRSQNPRYAGLTDPSPLGIDEIWRLLDDQTMLLEYSLGTERSFLWVVTAGRVSSFELAGRAAIDSAARHVIELITERNRRPPGETPEKARARIARADAEYRVAARTLADMVLGRVASELGDRRLVIIPDGALQYLPFGALPLPSSKSGRPRTGASRAHKTLESEAYRPLMADHEIVDLPSALVLATLRDDVAVRKPAPKLLAVLADPVFQADDPRVSPAGQAPSSAAAGPAGTKEGEPNASQRADGPPAGLSRLYFSRAEAEAIAALVPGENRMVALDFAASKATVESEAMGQYRILHYATHSIVDTEHPELSGIVLSTVDIKGQPLDGYVRLFEIYNLKLQADLVVLSACRTAMGREIKREGMMSITRGFMYAGSPRVVSSLWNVDDKATAELMKGFYNGMLVEGLRPAAALRAAQIAMWKRRCCSEPFFWGAFIIQGEWK